MAEQTDEEVAAGRRAGRFALKAHIKAEPKKPPKPSTRVERGRARLRPPPSGEPGVRIATHSIDKKYPPDLRREGFSAVQPRGFEPVTLTAKRASAFVPASPK